MLVIRFFRTGKKHQPSFKIIVTDKRRPPKGGRFVEELGFYNPLTKEKVLKAERIKYWLSVGAKLSDTVHNLLVSEKIIEGKKIPSHKPPKEKEEKVPEKPEVPEKLAEEVSKKEPIAPSIEVEKPAETKEKKLKEGTKEQEEVKEGLKTEKLSPEQVAGKKPTTEKIEGEMSKEKVEEEGSEPEKKK